MRGVVCGVVVDGGKVWVADGCGLMEYEGSGLWVVEFVGDVASACKLGAPLGAAVGRHRSLCPLIGAVNDC